jgi:uncharacterized protein (DUF934 family)
MPQLIKDGAFADDAWALLPEAYSLTDLPDRGAVIVPLALWHAERGALRARGEVGVLLAPADDPADLGSDIAMLPLIAVEFPQFTDGRGYSTARLLRERHHYHGELRAVGDVLRDQLYAMCECGFDAFIVREDRDAGDALAALREFDGLYAPTARAPQPWFRRCAATASTDPWCPDL